MPNKRVNACKSALLSVRSGLRQVLEVTTQKFVLAWHGLKSMYGFEFRFAARSS